MKLRRKKKHILTRDPHSCEFKSLSTPEVTELCKRVVEGTGCRYLGTFPAWGGPSADEWAAGSRPSAFVANTDLRENDGTHWCLFFLPREGKPYFFDSFARDPHACNRPFWTNFLARVSRLRGFDGTWDKEPLRLQDPNTAVCGHLCAMGLWYLSRGIDVPEDIPHDDIRLLMKIKRKHR
jgi:hypothetical protein